MIYEYMDIGYIGYIGDIGYIGYIGYIYIYIYDI